MKRFLSNYVRPPLNKTWTYEKRKRAARHRNLFKKKKLPVREPSYFLFFGKKLKK
jgi:hypothetical protein